ncbi:hypothetical protein BYZ73_19775 [Rhodovulum viride]|uniref:DUF4123 domain-containing protein n=2 Tax=Rhodovulum viride TaxID=1231134 RepID=A0ABX9DCZ5_9RHOB|nr:hypothetical protein BYZ73_19775 [Rhodovulum viride]
MDYWRATLRRIEGSQPLKMEVLALASSADEARRFLLCHTGASGRGNWLDGPFRKLTDAEVTPEQLRIIGGLSRKSPIAFGVGVPDGDPVPETGLARPTVTESGPDCLLDDPNGQLWALADGIAMPDLAKWTGAGEVESRCLYASPDPARRAIAPWLLRCVPGSAFWDCLRAMPPHSNWGIWLRSDRDLDELRAHLRRFTMLWTPANDHSPVYFRFYDPRVALDMSMALDPGHYRRLMACCSEVILPAGPELSPVDGIDRDDFLAPPARFSDRYLRIVTPAPDPEARGRTRRPESFRVSQAEFGRFETLHAARARRRMAARLAGLYGRVDGEGLIDAVTLAQKTGRRHGLSTQGQVFLLARYICEFGPDIFERDRRTAGILRDSDRAHWLREEDLRKRMPVMRAAWTGGLSAPGTAVVRPIQEGSRP